MQINKPPSSGTPSTASSAPSTAPDKANRASTTLIQLVGQVVNAQVIQSKAVQVAATQATLLQAGVAARLTLDERKEGSAPAPAAASTTNSSSSTAATSSSSAATAANTATSTTSATTTPPSQTQYQTTLQIGNERLVVMTEQPLPPGAQLTLKVTSPQALQLLEQPAAAAPLPTSDLADTLLNSLLRQALPLQQPVTRLLTSLAANLLLPSGDNTAASAPTSTGASSNLLATTPLPAAANLNIPAGTAPALVAALKPLLSQIIGSQLTLDTVTQPDALRSAVTNSGLFREARLVQWAQALLKQFPELATRGASAANPQSPQMPVNMPAGAAQAAASALAQAIATPGTASSAANPATANTGATPLDSSDNLLTAKQSDMLNKATLSATTSSQTTLHDAVDNGSTDVDALRNDLLKALSERAQKNQPAFTGSATKATVSAERTKISAGATATAQAGIPTNAAVNTKNAAAVTTATLPIASGVGADTKTTLEKLVSLASQQLLTKSGAAAPDAISEEHVIAILRQLPMAQTLTPHTANTQDKKEDDDQWLLQLLRSSFGALKHVQLQQAANLGATPSAHQTTDNPVPPLQIELPILVAQQWQHINIEIDRRAPENKADTGKTERGWRVTLRFELPQQGIIVAQLNLAGVSVSATLWAEKQATCQQLQQQLKDLSDRLGKVGAHVTTLDVRHGQPPAAKTRIEQRLIDVRT